MQRFLGHSVTLARSAIISVGVLRKSLPRTVWIATFAAGATFGLQGVGLADGTSTGADQLSEITVTAQRRTENLQQVPIAVQAFSAESLAAQNINGLRDLAVVAPSLTFSDALGNAQITLRGIGTPVVGAGFENPVALYVDGVYYASLAGNVLDFNNVESVEVINGPQGTLFGRNATGGLVQIHTKDPKQEFGSDVSVGYGNYNTTLAEAYITGGLSDHVASNLAVQVRDQNEGYGKNLATGKDAYTDSYLAARNKWLFDLSPNLTLRISADALKSQNRVVESAFPGTSPLGGPNPVRPHDYNSPYNAYSNTKQYGVAGTIAYNMGFATLNSISSWRRTQFEQLDAGMSTGDYGNAVYLKETHVQESQELQLVSATSSPLSWTVGAFYFRERAKWEPASPYSVTALGGYPVNEAGQLTVDVDNVTRSWAAYAQATWQMFTHTNLTVGARYTDERKSNYNQLASPFFGPLGYFSQDPTTSPITNNFDPSSNIAPFQGHLKANKVTWRAALDHQFTDHVMGYLSFNRGFRSGGFGVPTVTELKPETLDAYHIGLKTEILDNRLRLNSEAYYYDYKNIQVNAYVGGFPGYVNGPVARIYGIDEVATAVVTSNFTINAGLSLLHSKFGTFPNAPIYAQAPGPNFGNTVAEGPATGNQLPRASKAVFSLSGTYTLPLWTGSLDLTAAYSYNRGYNLDFQDDLRQGPFSLLNLAARWKSVNGFGVKLWAKNVTDKDYITFVNRGSNGDFTIWGAPRTYGVTLSKEF